MGCPRKIMVVAQQLAHQFVDELFCSDKIPGLLAPFGLKSLLESKFDEQIEQVNQIIEDMLRAYILKTPFKWENYLLILESAYVDLLDIVLLC